MKRSYLLISLTLIALALLAAYFLGTNGSIEDWRDRESTSALSGGIETANDTNESILNGSAKPVAARKSGKPSLSGPDLATPKTEEWDPSLTFRLQVDGRSLTPVELQILCYCMELIVRFDADFKYEDGTSESNECETWRLNWVKDDYVRTDLESLDESTTATRNWRVVFGDESQHVIPFKVKHLGNQQYDGGVVSIPSVKLYEEVAFVEGRLLFSDGKPIPHLKDFLVEDLFTLSEVLEDASQGDEASDIVTAFTDGDGIFRGIVYQETLEYWQENEINAQNYFAEEEYEFNYPKGISPQNGVLKLGDFAVKGTLLTLTLSEESMLPLRLQQDPDAERKADEYTRRLTVDPTISNSDDWLGNITTIYPGVHSLLAPPGVWMVTAYCECGVEYSVAHPRMEFKSGARINVPLDPPAEHFRVIDLVDEKGVAITSAYVRRVGSSVTLEAVREELPTLYLATRRASYAWTFPLVWQVSDEEGYDVSLVIWTKTYAPQLVHLKDLPQRSTLKLTERWPADAEARLLRKLVRNVLVLQTGDNEGLPRDRVKFQVLLRKASGVTVAKNEHRTLSDEQLTRLDLSPGDYEVACIPWHPENRIGKPPVDLSLTTPWQRIRIEAATTEVRVPYPPADLVEEWLRSHTYVEAYLGVACEGRSIYTRRLTRADGGVYRTSEGPSRQTIVGVGNSPVYQLYGTVSRILPGKNVSISSLGADVPGQYFEKSQKPRGNPRISMKLRSLPALVFEPPANLEIRLEWPEGKLPDDTVWFSFTSDGGETHVPVEPGEPRLRTWVQPGKSLMEVRWGSVTLSEQTVEIGDTLTKLSLPLEPQTHRILPIDWAGDGGAGSREWYLKHDGKSIHLQGGEVLAPLGICLLQAVDSQGLVVSAERVEITSSAPPLIRLKATQVLDYTNVVFAGPEASVLEDCRLVAHVLDGGPEQRYEAPVRIDQRGNIVCQLPIGWKIQPLISGNTLYHEVGAMCPTFTVRKRKTAIRSTWWKVKYSAPYYVPRLISDRHVWHFSGAGVNGYVDRWASLPIGTITISVKDLHTGEVLFNAIVENKEGVESDDELPEACMKKLRELKLIK